jgi:hypothetical protein
MPVTVGGANNGDASAGRGGRPQGCSSMRLPFTVLAEVMQIGADANFFFISKIHLFSVV